MKMVSIILPLFNAERYICATIASIQGQTHTNFELLVVDDCSTDNSMALVTELATHDGRIRSFSTNKNSGGPANPRNIGLSKASGDYFAFIDADDLWHERKLSYQIGEMEKLNLDFSSTVMATFYGKVDEPNLKAELNYCGKPIALDHEKLLHKNIIANSSVVLSRTWAENLLFSEDSEHVAVEDYLAWLNLHQDSKINSARLPAETLYYRNRAGSLSSIENFNGQENLSPTLKLST